MVAEHANDTLVLVPAYNASEHLHELVSRIRVYVCDANLLVVNDGSSDNTGAILQRENIKHLTLPENSGKGAALRAGFRYASEHGYRSVLTLDADLQHLPEEIPRFFAVDDGTRIVLGVRRFDPAVMPWPRRCSNNLTSLIVSVFSGRQIRDSQCGFRLLPVKFIRRVRLTGANYDLESQVILQASALGYPIVEIPVTTVYNNARSHVQPVWDIARFVRQIWRRIWL